jgi:hypothetical protein
MLGPRYVSLGGQRNLCAGCNRVPREVQIRPVLSFPRCGETRRLCQLCGESTRFPGLPFACHGQRVRISDATTTTTWNSPTREYIDERKDAMQEGAILQSCDGVAFEQREWERGVQDSSSSSAGRLVAALPNFDDGAMFRAARNRSQSGLGPWAVRAFCSLRIFPMLHDEHLGLAEFASSGLLLVMQTLLSIKVLISMCSCPVAKSGSRPCVPSSVLAPYGEVQHLLELQHHSHPIYKRSTRYAIALSIC